MMSNRSASIVVCVAAAVFIAYVLLTPREPSYDGKPLHEWFHQLEMTLVDPNGKKSVTPCLYYRGFAYGLPRRDFEDDPTNANPLTAICKIGTNALPFLLEKLGHQFNPVQNMLVLRWPEYTYRLFRHPEVERMQALTALLALSPLPATSRPQLLQLSTNANAFTQVAANFLLSNYVSASVTGHGNQ
jgi:hypothetical protein